MNTLEVLRNSNHGFVDHKTGGEIRAADMTDEELERRWEQVAQNIKRGLQDFYNRSMAEIDGRKLQ